jgi:hypothetical protein
MNAFLVVALGALALAGAPSVARAQNAVKEGWEEQPTAANQRLRSGAEPWQLSRGAGLKEGKAEIVEGKGKRGGKALSLAPDGDEGLIAYASVLLPPFETQDFRFSIRKDGEERLAARLFLKLGGRKEILRVNLGEGKANLNGNARASLSAVPDAEGWVDVGLKLDRKAHTATLAVGGEERTLEVEPWDEGRVAFQFTVNFNKGSSRQAVLLDDLSWTGEAP